LNPVDVLGASWNQLERGQAQALHVLFGQPRGPHYFPASMAALQAAVLESACH